MIFAMSIPGLAVLLLALATGERVWRTIRRKRGHPVVSRAAFDEFTQIMHGSKRIELDERQTELMRRDDEEDGAPPRGPIDLDSGAVRLSRSGLTTRPATPG